MGVDIVPSMAPSLVRQRIRELENLNSDTSDDLGLSLWLIAIKFLDRKAAWATVRTRQRRGRWPAKRLWRNMIHDALHRALCPIFAKYTPDGVPEDVLVAEVEALGNRLKFSEPDISLKVLEQSYARVCAADVRRLVGAASARLRQTVAYRLRLIALRPKEEVFVPRALPMGPRDCVKCGKHRPGSGFFTGDTMCRWCRRYE
jgi:hypothetical protein